MWQSLFVYARVLTVIQPVASEQICLIADSSLINQQVVKKLQIPTVVNFRAAKETGYEFALFFNQTSLSWQLHWLRDYQVTSTVSKTFITVNFSLPAITNRIRGISKRNELIARAIGLKQGKSNLKVLDTTAGIGQDAFILAVLGCEVLLLERNVILAWLLEDGMCRAKQNPQLQPVINRMELQCMDSLLWLRQNVIENRAVENKFDVIYCDPMFPIETHQSALPKKEMQIFRTLLGPDLDANELITLALQADCKRVVVKRPVKCLVTAEFKPDITYKGKSARFDVYLVTV